MEACIVALSSTLLAFLLILFTNDCQPLGQDTNSHPIQVRYSVKIQVRYSSVIQVRNTEYNPGEIFQVRYYDVIRVRA